MQQGRFTDAIKFYDSSFEDDSKNADLMHARCAARLSNGNFREAYQMWDEAKRIFPNHEGISLQSMKCHAYIYAAFNEVHRKRTLAMTDSVTILPSLCFLVKSILSPEECFLAIKYGNDAARERMNGWTTSRHYAVPTTDLPIHEVPLLLKWFNTEMNQTFRPLLANQFGEEEVGRGGCRIVVNDAFIVRYDSEKQRHLPLHRDESTYSFVISLNSSSEYDGGGTYIADLSTSIRPDIGSFLSFRGDKLLHGGDPVTRGVRYIIAAFCYSLEEMQAEADGCCDRASKRLKFNSYDQNKVLKETNKMTTELSTKEVSPFSFGFNV